MEKRNQKNRGKKSKAPEKASKADETRKAIKRLLREREIELLRLKGEQIKEKSLEEKRNNDKKKKDKPKEEKEELREEEDKIKEEREMLKRGFESSILLQGSELQEASAEMEIPTLEFRSRRANPLEASLASVPARRSDDDNGRNEKISYAAKPYQSAAPSAAPDYSGLIDRAEDLGQIEQGILPRKFDPLAAKQDDDTRRPLGTHIPQQFIEAMKFERYDSLEKAKRDYSINQDVIDRDGGRSKYRIEKKK